MVPVKLFGGVHGGLVKIQFRTATFNLVSKAIQRAIDETVSEGLLDQNEDLASWVDILQTLTTMNCSLPRERERGRGNFMVQ